MPLSAMAEADGGTAGGPRSGDSKWNCLPRDEGSCTIRPPMPLPAMTARIISTLRRSWVPLHAALPQTGWQRSMTQGSGRCRYEEGAWQMRVARAPHTEQVHPEGLSMNTLQVTVEAVPIISLSSGN